MHGVLSKSPPWGYTSQSNSRRLPDLPLLLPPLGLTLIGALPARTRPLFTDTVLNIIPLLYLWVYLGVNNFEVFLCFAAIVRVRPSWSSFHQTLQYMCQTQIVLAHVKFDVRLDEVQQIWIWVNLPFYSNFKTPLRFFNPNLIHAWSCLLWLLAPLIASARITSLSFPQFVFPTLFLPFL